MTRHSGLSNAARHRLMEVAAARRERRSRLRWALFGACIVVPPFVWLGDVVFGQPGAVAGAAIAVLVGVDHLRANREKADEELAQELHAIDASPMRDDEGFLDRPY